MTSLVLTAINGEPRVHDLDRLAVRGPAGGSGHSQYAEPAAAR